MNNILLISFIILYFVLETLHDFYVVKDLGRNSDAANPDRRKWHFFSAAQSGLVLLLLSGILFFDLHFNLPAYKFVLLFLFIRWIALDQFLNMLRGKNFFYVEKDNFFAARIQSIAKVTDIPAEVLMLILKLSMLILIIIL